jgi:hypothetical protein
VTQPDEQRPSGAQRAAEAAVAVEALRRAAPDPWLTLRWRRVAALATLESRLWHSYTAALREWLPQVASRVLSYGMIDPIAAEAMRPAFGREVDRIVSGEISDAFRQGWTVAFEDARRAAPGDHVALHTPVPPGHVALHTPVPPGHVERYLQGVRNRLVNVPDAVYRQITSEIAAGTGEGESMPELAARVHRILSAEGSATWTNRAVVVARTETIGAYNAGTLAGFKGFAATAGGDWEKGWLATHDHRVRPTHLAADLGTPGTGQRVPLDEPFSVGGAALMHPGDPSGPPEEVIQCRCSMVLVRPGEHVNLSNRQGKGPQ